MDLKAGDKVIHKMSGQHVFVLEVGPKKKKVFTGQGWVEQEYLQKGMVRVRLIDMRVFDVYDYEIEGIDPDGPRILVEKELPQ
jgi:hypothetical protein